MSVHEHDPAPASPAVGAAPQREAVGADRAGRAQRGGLGRLYDLTRFVGGGPADDERPAQLQPTLHARYFARRSCEPDHAQRMLAFYRFHICIMEAAWGEALGWTPGHIAWAERLIGQLSS